VTDLDSAQTKLLGAVDSNAVFAPDFLFFLRGRTLMAQAFNTKTLSLKGVAAAVASDVWTSADIYGLSSFSVSQNNVLVYRPAGAEATELHFYDRAGRDLGIAGSAGSHMEPFFSPDEKHVIFRRNHDLWMLDIASNNYSRFTFDPSDDVTMVWSPDGRKIVFGSNRTGPYDLFVKPASGSSQEQLLFHSAQTKYPDDWSPDGGWILFESVDPETKFDLWVLPMKGDRKPVMFEKSPANELHAQFSSDGRWVAYASDESGRTEIYVRPFASGEGAKWQISSNGGDQPFWNPDGKELFYLSPDNRIMSVNVKGFPDEFQPGAVTALFPVRIIPSGIPGSRGDYLPASNGQKFLVNTLVSDPSSAVINVVLNWATDLDNK
jgi:Tol biopolymer transport system component